MESIFACILKMLESDVYQVHNYIANLKHFNAYSVAIVLVAITIVIIRNSQKFF